MSQFHKKNPYPKSNFTICEKNWQWLELVWQRYNCFSIFPIFHFSSRLPKCRSDTWREFTRTCRVSSDMMNWGMGTIRWNPFRLDTSTAMRSYTNERTLLYPVNKHWFIYYIHIAREAKLQAPVQRVPNGISFLILSPWSLNYIRSRT